MIAEIFPEAYDAHGRKVLRPDWRRKGLRPTFPMGRYLSHPLAVKCDSIDDIGKFLAGCKYVSDERQFGTKDYWQAPENFEQTREGDCDCFALWSWRQFLALGFDDARFVTGRAGRYGAGHAWVQFSRNGKHFLAEPTMARVGNTLPRLNTLRYHPRFSVAWDGADISYYAHEDRRGSPPLSQLAALAPEWLVYWGWIWIGLLVLWPLFLLRKLFVGNKL